MDLAWNNLQRLLCHKSQQTKSNQNLYKIYEAKIFSYSKKGFVLDHKLIYLLLNNSNKKKMKIF